MKLPPASSGPEDARDPVLLLALTVCAQAFEADGLRSVAIVRMLLRPKMLVAWVVTKEVKMPLPVPTSRTSGAGDVAGEKRVVR